MPSPDYGIDAPTLSTVPDQPATRVLVADGPLFPRNDLSIANDTPVYEAFGVRVVYKRWRGLGSCPRAGKEREQQTALWRANSGRAVKVVTWVAQAKNQTPVAPHPDTGCDNEVLLEDMLISDVPPDGPDGQQTITLIGVYVYELQKVPALSDRLFIGKSPFNVRAALTISVYDFDKFIIGTSLSPGDFTGQAVNY